MARTTQQIKAEIATEWMNSKTIAEIYGFRQGTQFDSYYSKASIESLLLYIAAFCAHTVEAICDAMKSDIDETLQDAVPHRLRWYASKATQWQKGFTLAEGRDTYEDTESDEAQSARIVTHAVATEDSSGDVTVKVAKDEDGTLAPLSDEEREQFTAYMNEVKDAGVRLAVTSKAGDTIHVTAKVLYDPQRTASDVRNDIMAAVRQTVEALPFNGELTAMAIEDAMQTTDGVKVVSECGIDGSTDGRITPDAGWFAWTDDSMTLTLEPYA